MVFAVLFVVIVLGFVGVVMHRRRNALPSGLTNPFDNPSYTSSTGSVHMQPSPETKATEGAAGDLHFTHSEADA